MEIKRNIELVSMTPDPGKLIERIAAISYRTQRFMERQHPKMIKFLSGREVEFDQFGLDSDPEIGEPLPGYTKDDVVVAKIIPASYIRVVKFIIAIGHHAMLRNCHACFMITGISRKSALHFLRYEFTDTNFQSQKYLNQGDFEYLLPSEKDAPPGTRNQLKRCMATIQSMYEDLRKTGLDSEWSRGVLPNIASQTMSLSSNFEQIRHMCDCLCGDDYVGENQEVMMDILKIMKVEAPEFFHDFIIADDGKSASRRGYKYSRNKFVNWSLPADQKASFGLEPITQIPGKETEIE